jgi:hypothetical protein
VTQWRKYLKLTHKNHFEHNNALAPRPTQDHKCVQCKSKMMLEKKWLCNFFEILFLSRSTPFSTNSSNGSTHHAAIGGKPQVGLEE